MGGTWLCTTLANLAAEGVGEAAVVVLSHQTAALDELQIDFTVSGIVYAISSSIQSSVNED